MTTYCVAQKGKKSHSGATNKATSVVVVTVSGLRAVECFFLPLFLCLDIGIHAYHFKIQLCPSVYVYFNFNPH